MNIVTRDLINVFFYNDDPRGNGLLILYKGVIKGGKIMKNSEAQGVKFFSPNEIPLLKLAGGSHDHAILEWLNEQEMVTDS